MSRRVLGTVDPTSGSSTGLVRWHPTDGPLLRSRADIADLEQQLLILARRGGNPSPPGRAQADDVALERSSYLLLGLLDEHGPVRVGSLALVAGLDPSTVSRQVTVALDRGHAQRTPDPDDGRGTLVELTDLGRTTLRAARRNRRTRLEETLSAWSPTDRHLLVSMLTRLNQDLSAEG